MHIKNIKYIYFENNFIKYLISVPNILMLPLNFPLFIQVRYLIAHLPPQEILAILG